MINPERRKRPQKSRAADYMKGLGWDGAIKQSWRSLPNKATWRVKWAQMVMWHIISSNTGERIVTSLMFARDIIVVKDYYFGG